MRLERPSVAHALIIAFGELEVLPGVAELEHDVLVRDAGPTPARRPLRLVVSQQLDETMYVVFGAELCFDARGARHAVVAGLQDDLRLEARDLVAELDQLLAELFPECRDVARYRDLDRVGVLPSHSSAAELGALNLAVPLSGREPNGPCVDHVCAPTTS